MKSKGILVNYIGYPLYISALMPDCGLATLAGSLIAADHKVKILDFSNADIIPELFPQQYAKEFNNVLESVNAEIISNRVIPQEMLSELHVIDAKISEYRMNKLDDFALKINSEIKKCNADFIGFKLFAGDGFKGSIAIAEKIKELNPGIKIFAGGPQVDMFEENIFKVTAAFDALAVGDGDRTIIKLAELCDGTQDIKKIPNLIYKENGTIHKTKCELVEHLETLDLPEYGPKIYPGLKGNSKIRIFFIDESRGCPYSCNFCLHPVKSGGSWRVKSPARIVREIETVMNDFGTHAFKFAGSNTPAFLNKKIAQTVIERGIRIKYTSFGHVGCFEGNYFRTLKKAGCQSLFFGIESGSQFILDNSINKKIKVEDIRTTIQQAKESGIFAVTSWIMPAPLETEETKEETFNMIQEIRPDSCLFTVPVVTMGTEWHKNYEKYNIEIKDKEDIGLAMMTYQAKMTFPTQLWKPFPYKINGKEFHELTKESNEFVCRLSNIGIPTNITDDSYLMSLYTEYSPAEFRDKTREYILRGDYRKIKRLCKEINKNIKYY